jgi:hypothetical protein
MKKTLYLLVVICTIGCAGCSSNNQENQDINENVTTTVAEKATIEETTEVTTIEETTEEQIIQLDLSGKWKQTNSKSEDDWQEAIIEGDIIEIYWVSDGGDTKSLYWAGTYEAPAEGIKTYSWDSVNDHEKTNGSMLASSDDTKTITYEDGELSYEVSAMGTTSIVRLQKK